MWIQGAAVVALALGVLALCLSPLPVPNPAGILVGIAGVAVGIVAVVLGPRPSGQVVVAVIGLLLSTFGIVATLGLTATHIYNSDPTVAPSVPYSGTGRYGSSSGSQATTKKTLLLEGTARRAGVNYRYGSTWVANETVPVPWSKTLVTAKSAPPAVLTASIEAYIALGSSGDLTCSILDENGTVLSRKTAVSQGGHFGEGWVQCNG